MRHLIVILFCFFQFNSFAQIPPIIPKPRFLEVKGDTLSIPVSFNVYINESDDLTYFRELLLKLTEKSFKRTHEKDSALIRFFENKSFQDQESYAINISSNRINVLYGNNEGLFRSIQTLVQLFTFYPDYLPAFKIIDQPAYPYRGMMLDVARHFMDVPTVKRVIDYLAIYKMNHLHLHLADDQGWRIEIKSWPKLTEIGSKSEVGGGEGGYYTQEEYAELVTYADDRFVTIVPEIDMPGHTNAALASYAILNCDNQVTEYYTGTKVGFSSLCVGKDTTYSFIDDVVREISELTTGPYFHIGGDEPHSTAKDDYVYFIDRVLPIVGKYNKRVIGWDEIAISNLDSGTVVQYWQNFNNARLGEKKGAKILLSIADHAYLDMKYNAESSFGLTWAGYTGIQDAYEWKNVDLNNIIGIEAPLWSETITNLDEMEYLMFPRVIGHSELAWFGLESIDWEEYRKRLSYHSIIFKKLGISFYPSKEVPWK